MFNGTTLEITPLQPLLNYDATQIPLTDIFRKIRQKRTRSTSRSIKNDDVHIESTTRATSPIIDVRNDGNFDITTNKGLQVYSIYAYIIPLQLVSEEFKTKAEKYLVLRLIPAQGMQYFKDNTVTFKTAFIHDNKPCVARYIIDSTSRKNDPSGVITMIPFNQQGNLDAFANWRISITDAVGFPFDSSFTLTEENVRKATIEVLIQGDRNIDVTYKFVEDFSKDITNLDPYGLFSASMNFFSLLCTDASKLVKANYNGSQTLGELAEAALLTNTMSQAYVVDFLNYITKYSNNVVDMMQRKMTENIESSIIISQMKAQLKDLDTSVANLMNNQQSLLQQVNDLDVSTAISKINQKMKELEIALMKDSESNKPSHTNFGVSVNLGITCRNLLIGEAYVATTPEGEFVSTNPYWEIANVRIITRAYTRSFINTGEIKIVKGDYPNVIHTLTPPESGTIDVYDQYNHRNPDLLRSYYVAVTMKMIIGNYVIWNKLPSVEVVASLTVRDVLLCGTPLYLEDIVLLS